MGKRQRLRPDLAYSPNDLKLGQAVFREWCGDNGIVVEVIAAADLCKKIAGVIASTRRISELASEDEAAEIERLRAALQEIIDLRDRQRGMSGVRYGNIARRALALPSTEQRGAE